MDFRTANKILDIQEKAMEDAQYRILLEELAQQNAQMLELYETLPKEQLAVLMDYLGVCISMRLRLLEIACSERAPS